jgi:hypothetical protein
MQHPWFLLFEMSYAAYRRYLTVCHPYDVISSIAIFRMEPTFCYWWTKESTKLLFLLTWQATSLCQYGLSIKITMVPLSSPRQPLFFSPCHWHVRSTVRFIFTFCSYPYSSMHNFSPRLSVNGFWQLLESRKFNIFVWWKRGSNTRRNGVPIT